MLLSFSFENFRSLYDKAEFSMVRGLKRELSKKVFICEADKAYSILPTKVIYGVNASGKTSLILGLRSIQELIIAGDLNKKYDCIGLLPIYHFMHDEKAFLEPTKLSISYVDQGDRFDYEVWIKNTDFDKELHSAICYEKLDINGYNIFIRENRSVQFNIDQYSKIQEFLYNTKEEDLVSLSRMSKDNIGESLIFTSWFSINSEFVERVKKWFTDKIHVLKSLDEITFDISSFKTEEDIKDLNTINNIILSLVKEADFGPQIIKFEIDKEDNSTYLQSIYKINNSNEIDNYKTNLQIRSEVIESLGTMKLIKFIGPFLSALADGELIVIDELDSSIHPEVIASIIKVFSNHRINTKGAQLIFTTHNPIFLNKNLFRRDEIVFVEKDSDTFKSTISTLEDFEVRGDEIYLKNYLNGKYISFANINFSKIIRELDEKDEEK